MYYLSILELKLIHVSKRDPWPQWVKEVDNQVWINHQEISLVVYVNLDQLLIISGHWYICFILSVPKITKNLSRYCHSLIVLKLRMGANGMIIGSCKLSSRRHIAKVNVIW